MPPCRLRQKKILKIWLRNGAFWSISEQMCGQHSAVLYTCLPWLLSKYNTDIESCSFFACLRFLIFHPLFQGGQLTPFAPMCGRPWVLAFEPSGHAPALCQVILVTHPGARFTKYLTTVLRLSYNSARVTIDLRWMSNLRNVLRRKQGFS